MTATRWNAISDAYDGLDQRDDMQEARLRLHRLAANWDRRAQVKREELKPETLLDAQRPDFLPELLPFQSHPAFLAAPDMVQHMILSCGWLAYNEKTVDIESHIITPSCLHIVYGEVPGLRDGVSRQLASETLVDEAYHTLLVSNASSITRTQRHLEGLPIPTSALVTRMRQAQALYSDTWQKILIQLATAIVSEVFISDYLKLLSGEESIQAFNRLTVAMHRRDELAHSSIFRNLAKCLYAALSTKERAFFLTTLPKPVRWFANLEWDVWRAMLDYIGFPQAATLIDESRQHHEENLTRLDYSSLIALAEELDMGPDRSGLDSFYQEGLLDDPISMNHAA
jgi:alpha-N-dichloroacetyl-p-aminophenylserinol N-oxygenase